MPWDRGQPNTLLVEWVDREQPDVTSRTVVVGAGYGRGSEFFAGLGHPTTGFDISPAAVEQTKRRFPDSLVEYAVGDLLVLPAAWRGGSDLVVAAGHDGAVRDALDIPPWALLRQGVQSFARDGLELGRARAGRDDR